MKRWGCFGLTLGGMIGLLLVLLFFVWARQLAASSQEIQPVSVDRPDVTLFLSERSLSHFAAEALEIPTVVDLKPGGQIEITTRIQWGWLRPVVRLGLSLGIQGTDVMSQLDWVQMGFLKIPASWLPQSVIRLGAMPGETITRQAPPEFEVVGLATTPAGVEVQLNWVGP